jgi:hypothetical protein
VGVAKIIVLDPFETLILSALAIDTIKVMIVGNGVSMIAGWPGRRVVQC